MSDKVYQLGAWDPEKISRDIETARRKQNPEQTVDEKRWGFDQFDPEQIARDLEAARRKQNLGGWLWAKIEELAAEPDKQQAGKTVQQESGRSQIAKRAVAKEDCDYPSGNYIRECAEEWGMSEEDASNNMGFDKD